MLGMKAFVLQSNLLNKLIFKQLCGSCKVIVLFQNLGQHQSLNSLETKFIFIVYIMLGNQIQYRFNLRNHCTVTYSWITYQVAEDISYQAI